MSLCQEVRIWDQFATPLAIHAFNIVDVRRWAGNRTNKCGKMEWMGDMELKSGCLPISQSDLLGRLTSKCGGV